LSAVVHDPQAQAWVSFGVGLEGLAVAMDAQDDMASDGGEDDEQSGGVGVLDGVGDGFAGDEKKMVGLVGGEADGGIESDGDFDGEASSGGACESMEGGGHLIGSDGGPEVAGGEASGAGEGMQLQLGDLFDEVAGVG
jgi:hypothetical protein